MRIVFDNPLKPENKVARRFLRFYFAREEAPQQGTIRVEDGERLVSDGPRPDYYIPSVSMLLEVGGFVDKQIRRQVGGFAASASRIRSAMTQLDLSALTGCWLVDLPRGKTYKTNECKRIAEDLLDAMKAGKTRLSSWPDIRIQRPERGDNSPFDLWFGESRGRDAWYLAMCSPPSIFEANWKKIEHAARQLCNERISVPVRNRVLLLVVDEMCFGEWAMNWLHEQKLRYADLESVDEVWAWSPSEKAFKSLYSRRE